MKIVNDNRSIPPKRCFPLPVGNGSLSLLVDFTGSTRSAKATPSLAM
jgi:hypothetical protein